MSSFGSVEQAVHRYVALDSVLEVRGARGGLVVREVSRCCAAPVTLLGRTPRDGRKDQRHPVCSACRKAWNPETETGPLYSVPTDGNAEMRRPKREKRRRSTLLMEESALERGVLERVFGASVRPKRWSRDEWLRGRFVVFARFDPRIASFRRIAEAGRGAPLDLPTEPARDRGCYRVHDWAFPRAPFPGCEGLHEKTAQRVFYRTQEKLEDRLHTHKLWAGRYRDRWRRARGESLANTA